MDAPVVDTPDEAPPKPPPLWPGFVTLTLSLVLILVGSVFVAAVVMGYAVSQGRKIDAVTLMTEPGAIVLAALVSQLGLLVAVRFLPGLFKDVGPDGWFARVAWTDARFSPGRALVAWLGTLAAGSLATYVLEPLRQASDLLTRFGESARNAPPALFAMLLLVGAVAPGICEELMFRGLLQTRLIQRWGPLGGILFTAFLFGVYHFDVRQGLAAMAMGWWLGWFSWRDGSTVNVAFGHMLNNATAFLLSRFTPAVEAHERSPAVATAAAFLLLGCIAASTFLTKKQAAA